MLITPQAVAFTRTDAETRLADIAGLETHLQKKYSRVLSTDFNLTRKLVSFQANKGRPRFRWFKFKEAFSADLVDYLLDAYAVRSGSVLDPFAGMGTALFSSSYRGLDAEGIELLPVGAAIINAHTILAREFKSDDIDSLRAWRSESNWRLAKPLPLNSLRITRGAYPDTVEKDIGRFLGALRAEKNPRVQAALNFALLCILEEISYTRKDGQFLRWDHRSGRDLKQEFNKGAMPSFKQAITVKLDEIIADLCNKDLLPEIKSARRGHIKLHEGSCLRILPSLPEKGFGAVLTSPPYCNRYDYTRTYALELAMLGVTEDNLKQLRQTMLSCTVENREKDLASICPLANASSIAGRHSYLRAVCSHLRALQEEGRLNNSGLIRMVEGYFQEMACVIAECARVLKSGGLMFMVNDNVRIGGAAIPVDLILSDIAIELGFIVENILVLPQSKGNSSQQMGEYGRVPLRKCVYVWRLL